MCCFVLVHSIQQSQLVIRPLHVLVQEFVAKIINSPELLVSPDALFVEGMIDRKEWDNPKAMKAVFELMPKLPHLKQITVAFFNGANVTWKHFSAEFALGRLIDKASAEEKHLAWMPPTNNVNEGALGGYQVTNRGKPSMTLHQYNVMAMFKHNETQSYMDATYLKEDHQFI